MENLESLASFLQIYGAHAMSSVFIALYFIERRERRTTQRKFEAYLTEASARVIEVVRNHSVAVSSLEQALARSGALKDGEKHDD